MYDYLSSLIESGLVILVPVLNLIGFALKKSAVKDKWIPWALGIIAVMFCGIRVFSDTQIYGLGSVLAGIFTALTQGILIAGASVYLNQVVKQTRKEE